MKNRSQKFPFGIALALCLISAFHNGCDSGGGRSENSKDPNPSIAYQVYGLNFGPYENGQDPNQGAVVSAEQIERRMRIIAPYTRWIRTFGCTRGLEYAGGSAPTRRQTRSKWRA